MRPITYNNLKSKWKKRELQKLKDEEQIEYLFLKYSDILFTRGLQTEGNYQPDGFYNEMFPINAEINNVQALNILEEGYAVTQRVGNKIKMISLELNLFMTAYTLVNIQPFSPVIQNSRVLIVYDKEPNGKYPTWQDVMDLAKSQHYDDPDPGDSSSYFQNVNNIKRFEIIYDRVIIQPSYGVDPLSTPNFELTKSLCGPTNSQNFYIREKIDLDERVTMYTKSIKEDENDPENITSITSGALLLMGYGSESYGGIGFGLTGVTRLTYINPN